MPKIKTCPHCGEPLVCKACGRLHTPLKQRHRRAMSFKIGDDAAAELERVAEVTGCSMTAVLEGAIKLCGDKTPDADEE
jgi:hypothetical protein